MAQTKKNSFDRNIVKIAICHDVVERPAQPGVTQIGPTVWLVSAQHLIRVMVNELYRLLNPHFLAGGKRNGGVAAI